MPELARFFEIIIHQAELLAAWEQLQAGRPPGKIEPLR